MRSPLVPLITGTLTVVLVTAAALVWAFFLRSPGPVPASEVVVGESPEGATVEPTDEGVVPPPPPVTEESGEPTETSPEAEPSAGPAPTGFPFDCLDEGSGHESWGEDQWDDWWELCQDQRFGDDDDDD
ncbi:hypothetical protein [Nocardiopsis listeri]|uniref:hypothetical protein n=1 Tax=Nocardiopsis listeri TaxID=53440 RepID=UPI001CC20F1A|nr:hypothetical protein [Nocardiopsis listeri]